jgi:hypothetical protein
MPTNGDRTSVEEEKMIHIILISVLAVVVGIVCFKKSRRWKITTAVMLLVLLAIREGSIILFALGLVDHSTLSETALGYFRWGAHSMVQVYASSFIFALAIWLLILALCLRGFYDPETQAPKG